MPKVLVRDEPDFVDRPTCGFRPYLHEAVVFSQMYWKFTDADAGLYRGTQHEAGIEGRYDAPRVYRFAGKRRRSITGPVALIDDKIVARKCRARGRLAVLFEISIRCKERHGPASEAPRDKIGIIRPH